jgi:hypothetical protein
MVDVTWPEGISIDGAFARSNAELSGLLPAFQAAQEAVQMLQELDWTVRARSRGRRTATKRLTKTYYESALRLLLILTQLDWVWKAKRSAGGTG